VETHCCVRIVMVVVVVAAVLMVVVVVMIAVIYLWGGGFSLEKCVRARGGVLVLVARRHGLRCHTSHRHGSASTHLFK
jgi:hypothetical protein